MPGLVPGIHVFHRLLKRDVDGRDKPGHDGVWLCSSNPSNQILFGDDFAEPAVIRNEFLDEFMDAVLEDVVHVTVLQAIADAAGMSLCCALAAIVDTEL